MRLERFNECNREPFIEGWEDKNMKSLEVLCSVFRLEDKNVFRKIFFLNDGLIILKFRSTSKKKKQNIWICL